MKKKYYFCDLIDDSACFSYSKIVDFCKEHSINQITVFQAERVTGEGTFYCDLYKECGDTSDSNCGIFCDGYDPLNGKNGRCKHSKYCYEKGAGVTFHNILTHAECEHSWKDGTEEASKAELAFTKPNAERKVALCWATKKRHIAVDGKILCNSDHKTAGFSVKNGGYNTLSLSGLPTYDKTTDDSKYTHSDGNIPFCAMDKQPTKIDTHSICRKCLKKYKQLLAL